MTGTVRIKPTGKLYVRHPDNGHRHLAPEGEEVVMNDWWYRRLAEKEIVIVPEADAPAAAPITKEQK